MDNTPVWLTILLAVIASGVLNVIFTWVLNRGKESRASLQSFIDVLNQDNAQLRVREDKLQTDLDEYKAANELEKRNMLSDLADLRSTVQLLQSTTQSAPVAMWLKNMKLEMLSLNQAYEDLFLMPRGLSRRDYIGKTDVDVWPEEIAKAFQKNDYSVIRTGKTLYAIEKVITNDGLEVDCYVVKFVRWAGPVKVGIAGIAFLLEDFKDN